MPHEISDNLSRCLGKKKFGSVLASPPWRIPSINGRGTEDRFLGVDEISSLPIQDFISEKAHLYLFTPNELIPDGISIMKKWGFDYKSNLIINTSQKESASEYGQTSKFFKDITQMVLFGVRGKGARTLDPGRTQVNYFNEPFDAYKLVEDCSPAPYLELFKSNSCKGWTSWNW